MQRHTRYVERVIFGIGSDVDAATAQVFADRFRDPVVARAGTETPTERSCCARYQRAQGIPRRAGRRCRFARFLVPATAVDRSLVAPETANADDYTLEKVDATHFIIDERPDLVRARLIALAEETAA